MSARTTHALRKYAEKWQALPYYFNNHLEFLSQTFYSSAVNTGSRIV